MELGLLVVEMEEHLKDPHFALQQASFGDLQ